MSVLTAIFCYFLVLGCIIIIIRGLNIFSDFGDLAFDIAV